MPTVATADRRSPSTAATAFERVFAAGVVFAMAVVVHNADHVRRGADAVGADVFWVGTAAIGMEVTLVVVMCRRHRFAPLGAAVGGFALSAGYLFVHFLGGRQWLSDPLLGESDVDAWSRSVASVEALSAFALGVVGLIALYQLGGVQAAAAVHPQQRTLRDALLHPVALAFTVSQAITLAASFAQVLRP